MESPTVQKRLDEVLAELKLVRHEIAELKGPTPNGAALTAVAAAKQLCVSKETIYRLCAEGALPHIRIRNRISITPEQLRQYREEQER